MEHRFPTTARELDGFDRSAPGRCEGCEAVEAVGQPDLFAVEKRGNGREHRPGLERRRVFGNDLAVLGRAQLSASVGADGGDW
jgi:hypothetical protein